MIPCSKLLESVYPNFQGRMLKGRCLHCNHKPCDVAITTAFNFTMVVMNGLFSQEAGSSLEFLEGGELEGTPHVVSIYSPLVEHCIPFPTLIWLFVGCNSG